MTWITCDAVVNRADLGPPTFQHLQEMVAVVMQHTGDVGALIVPAAGLNQIVDARTGCVVNNILAASRSSETVPVVGDQNAHLRYP